MALPANVSTGRIKGRFINLFTGDPIVGSIVIEAQPVRISDPGELTVLVPRKLTVPLVNGTYDRIVPATNDEDLTPTAFTYKITEKFTGGSTYSIEVPAGATIDLSSVTHVDPDTGNAELVQVSYVVEPPVGLH